MKFEAQETGRYLRAKALSDGPEERMRALQALSHGYGKGSEGALARMLLATLGGDESPKEPTIMTGEAFSDCVAIATVTLIGEPMQKSANDSCYFIEGATSAS